MTASASCAGDWPLWQEFVHGFIQQDGRVIDASVKQQHSTSEGQSYAMFFALVANDRATFDRLWRWSRSNLMGGNAAQLPAWQWGRADDGNWRVLDANSASDADLWFAYALIEAGGLWNRADYRNDGLALLKAAARDEVAELPGLGRMLLPGRVGFVGDDGVYRLNPSYLPMPLLRRFAAVDRRGPWRDVAGNAVAVLAAFPRTRLTPDWLAYRVGSDGKGIYLADPSRGDRGSYDAIRAYLWAGATAPGDRLSARLLDAQRGMVARVPADGAPPEEVFVASGEARGDGPFGFSAALLPYLRALGETAKADAQRRRALALLQQARLDAASGKRVLPYYDYVLSLFGFGWDEGRYRFQATGKLQPSWEKTCQRTASN